VVHYGYDPALYSARAKDQRNMRLLELEHARDPENARVLYFIGQQHFAAYRYAVAALWLERFVERADQVAPYFLIEAYRMWLEALSLTGDGQALERVARIAEDRGALSAMAREVLSGWEAKQGRFGIALQHLVAALDPGAPAGITSPPGLGGWRTRLLLAQLHERTGDRGAALAEVERLFAELPSALRCKVASQATELAVRSNQLVDAARWLARAAESAPDTLDAHENLLRLSLDLERRAPVMGDLTGPLERALVSEDWQAAYDAAMALPMGSNSTLARILFLARRLREQGAPDAALDLLGQVVDAYPPSRPLYMLLMQTLKDLDRFDDALVAIEVLNQLPEAEKSLEVAA
jgi:tetratricopeptide (TPR) repeat protein